MEALSRFGIGPRLGSTDISYKRPLNSSDYFEECWWTLEDQPENILSDETSFVFSKIESYIAGVIFAFMSFAGVTLNFLLIVAILRNPKFRKEYLASSIVSMAISDFIFMSYFIPITSIHYILR